MRIFLPRSAQVVLLIAAAGSSAAAASPQSRQLTFEDRLRAQEAIERVYYAHQIVASLPFDQAAPRAVLERKVRDYLRKSAALDRYWSTPITAAMLRAETERIARATRFPDRLREIQVALGGDDLLFEETFVRATLADRLARSFFAADERLHDAAAARTEWDAWWSGAREELDESSVETVAAGDALITGPLLTGGCGPTDVWINGSLDDVPDPRPNATMVWTGTLVLVWGGGDFEQINFFPPGSYNSGGRYDPLTDTWTPMSRLNAPAPRFSHTAVWTGSEMIVWGGYDDIFFLWFGDGGRYDPVSDTWTAMPAAGAPTPRFHHTAVWTGSEMIVWGGQMEVLPGYLDTGGRYDPSTNSWSPTTMTGAPAAREQHTAVWTGSEMIVSGGHGTADYTSGSRYNPATDTWIPMAAAPATGDDAAVWTGSEMIVWGSSVSNTGKRYRPATDTWTLTSTAGAPTYLSHLPGGVWTGTEMIVWGGCGQTVCAAGRYNPATDHWSLSTTVNSPRARKNHAMVWTGSQMIVWGGYLTGVYTGYNNSTNTGGRYDPAADSWTPTSVGGAPAPRDLHSSVWTGSLVIVWSVGTGGRYDPLTDSWTPTSTLNAPGGGIGNTAVWTGTRMIVWGPGATTGGRYDPVADAWSPTSTAGAPSARYHYATVWTGSEMIVWGGEDNTTPYLASGGRYSPATDSWAPVSTAGAPTAREYFTAVWTGSRMIVWGGDAGSGIFFNTGGRYDPATDSWTATSTLNAPAARHSQTAVWTGTEMIVWGGVGGGPQLADGGRYDPATDTWMLLPATSLLTGRLGNTATWTGREMIVWGGIHSNFLALADGARYDPAANQWAAVSMSSAPTPRGNHTAVWIGDSLLVWGGTDYFTGFSSGGRYFPGPEPDRDGDGVRLCDGDCDDTNAAVWSTPGEVPSVDLLGDRATLTWTPPAAPGGTAVIYDTLRTSSAFDFTGAATCVESGDGSDLQAHDGTAPPAGGVFYYLVRADNGCPAGLGQGSLGAASDGTPRAGRSCP